MINSIPDSLVDSVTIAPALPEFQSRYVEIDAQGKLSPIQDLLESIDLNDLDACAKGAREQVGLGTETADCVFGNCPEPGEEPFNGVQIRSLFGGFPPLKQVVISYAAFDRLISRYFATIISVAEQRYPRVCGKFWWTEFLEDVAFIEARVQYIL